MIDYVRKCGVGYRLNWRWPRRRRAVVRRRAAALGWPLPGQPGGILCSWCLHWPARYLYTAPRTDAVSRICPRCAYRRRVVLAACDHAPDEWLRLLDAAGVFPREHTPPLGR